MNPLVYVTRDIERALGGLTIPTFFIISNDSVFAKSIKKIHDERVTLITHLNTLSTHELLEHDETIRILGKIKNPEIVVFKNTSKIEKWCNERGYTLLNPASKLASSIEEKITQLETLKDILEFMPKYEIKTIGEMSWMGIPFVLQFNHSHTGNGTIYIDSKELLDGLKEKFQHRKARIAPFIAGPIFTSNIVVGKNTTLRGNISYQITGLRPFTDVQFATIGNDWGAPYRILNESERASYDHMAKEIAQTLRNLGWKGLFGIDAIWSSEQKRWYLIEINARQPASASYESKLQSQIKQDEETITVLEAHIRALRGETLDGYSMIKISNGAQIIQRVTTEVVWHKQVKEKIQKLEEKKWYVIPYNNTEHNSDLLRIQSETSMIETHNEFTDQGKEICAILN